MHHQSGRTGSPVIEHKSDDLNNLDHLDEFDDFGGLVVIKLKLDFYCGPGIWCDYRIFVFGRFNEYEQQRYVSEYKLDKSSRDIKV